MTKCGRSMESSQSSSSRRNLRTQGNNAGKVTSERRGRVPACKCGHIGVEYTSWTSENPGRKFYGCLYYKVWIYSGFCFEFEIFQCLNW